MSVSTSPPPVPFPPGDFTGYHDFVGSFTMRKLFPGCCVWVSDEMIDYTGTVYNGFLPKWIFGYLETPPLPYIRENWFVGTLNPSNVTVGDWTTLACTLRGFFSNLYYNGSGGSNDKTSQLTGFSCLDGVSATDVKYGVNVTYTISAAGGLFGCKKCACYKCFQECTQWKMSFGTNIYNATASFAGGVVTITSEEFTYTFYEADDTPHDVTFQFVMTCDKSDSSKEWTFSLTQSCEFFKTDEAHPRSIQCNCNSSLGRPLTLRGNLTINANPIDGTVCGYFIGSDISGVEFYCNDGGATAPADPPCTDPGEDSIEYIPVEERMALRAGSAKRKKAPKPVVARPTPCKYLAARKETKTGCTGFSCLHECGIAATRPDVADHLGGIHPKYELFVTRPSDECQTCPGYEKRMLRPKTKQPPPVEPK